MVIRRRIYTKRVPPLRKGSVVLNGQMNDQANQQMRTLLSPAGPFAGAMALASALDAFRVRYRLVTLPCPLLKISFEVPSGVFVVSKVKGMGVGVEEPRLSSQTHHALLVVRML